MSAFTAASVKELRDATGAGMMDCKKALTETGGDFDKAVEFLRKKGIETANKKSGREAKEGLVQSYIHNGKIGVLIEVNCETDFVAKNEAFIDFTKDVAMHIAAVNPQYISGDEIPEEVIAKEKEIFKEQNKNKPENVIEKILEGKINKMKEEVCLLEQSYVKDDSIKIKDLLTQAIAKLGENIIIKRFVRFELGS